MKLNITISKKSGLQLLSFFLAVSIVFRCSPTIIYQNTLVEYIVIMACVIGSLFCLTLYRLYMFEVFILLTPLLCFTNFSWTKYVFYIFVGTYYYFCIQKNCECFNSIKIPILFFSGLTAFVTWFSFVSPTMYKSKILPIFSNNTSIVSQFTNQNMYMGFTDHFSRNAFFMILGIMVLLSDIIAKEKRHKKTRILFILFLIITELLVAKKGPLLFLILSILIVVFLKEPSILKGTVRFWKYIMGIVILILLAIIFIPGANNIIVRITEAFQSGDMTTSRGYLYTIALNMFKSNPLLGQGWDSFRLSMLSMSASSTFQGVHNDYLQYLAETGIIGFVIVIIANIGALIYTIKGFNIIKRVEYSGTKIQSWSVFVLLYQIFILLYALTGLPHFSYEQYTLYLMACGYGVSVYRMIIKNKLRKV